jgi:hypothetical protein
MFPTVSIVVQLAITARRIETHRHIENNSMAHRIHFFCPDDKVVGEAALNTNNGGKAKIYKARKLHASSLKLQALAAGHSPLITHYSFFQLLLLSYL